MRGKVLILAVVALAACYDTKHEGADDGDIDGADDGGTEGETDASPPDPAARAALDAYCGAIAEATCDGLEACCADGWSEGRRERCRDVLRDPCIATIGPDVDTGDVTIAAGGADACRAAITAAIAGCPAELREPALLPECVAAIRGTAEPGGCCDGGQVCGTGLGCGLVDDCTCEEGATCRVLPGEGEYCLAGYLCARGLVCGAGSTCKAPLPAGASCDLSNTDECIGRCSDVCVVEAWDYCHRDPAFSDPL